MIYINIPIYRYETYYHDTNINIFISIDARVCAGHHFNAIMEKQISDTESVNSSTNSSVGSSTECLKVPTRAKCKV